MQSEYYKDYVISCTDGKIHVVAALVLAEVCLCVFVAKSNTFTAKVLNLSQC